jgi:rhombotail lipoprotein
MRLTGLCLLASGLMLAACGAISPRRYSPSDLQEQLDSQPPLFTDADIAELEALAPQLPVPFRLGVAPPLSVELDESQVWWRGDGARSLSFGTWSADEAAVIEDWGRRFGEAGIVSELVILPRLLVQGSSTEEPASLLGTLRQAAARHHLDAVLVVNRVSASQSHPGFLSILDITVVGGFIVPAYEVSSMTVMEAALVDTRNGYLYASARGDGSVAHHAPAFQTEASMDEGRKRARVLALEDLGEDLRRQTNLAMMPQPVR